MTLLTNKQTLT